MAEFSITITANTVEAFKAAVRRAQNMRPVWNKVDRLLRISIDKNFQVRGRPKWRRRKRPAKHPILEKSGKLRGSIDARHFISGVDVGTPVVYAATHQFGRGAIAARPFVVAQESDKEQIVKLIERWVIGPLK